MFLTSIKGLVNQCAMCYFIAITTVTPHDPQAILCKFHSVFLSERGWVYTCGHGHGGRLGHGNDKTCLVSSFLYMDKVSFSPVIMIKPCTCMLFLL